MGRAFLWLVCLRGFSALPITTPSLLLPGDSCWAPADGRWQGAAPARSWSGRARLWSWLGQIASFLWPQFPPARWALSWEVAVLVLNPDSSLH